MTNKSRVLSIETLRRASETARAAISSKCIGGMIRPPEDPRAYAWGQYLEIRGRSVQIGLGKQYGIYGTSAAVQILAMQSSASHRDLILWGSRVLPLVQRASDATYHQLHEKFEKKGDLSTVYKLCSLLDAATVLEPLSGSDGFEIDRAGILRELLNMRLPDAGWPDFKSDTSEWQGPNTHATAVALLALSKGVLSVETEAACRESLTWFCEQPLEKQSIATLSMLTMTYANLTSTSASTSQFLQGRLRTLYRRCEGLVNEWVNASFPDEVQRSLEGIEYWLPPAAAKERNAMGVNFTFLLYLPHVLAASAVLASPRLRNRYICRQYVLGVVDRVATELNSQGCFIAAGRSMVSTVEHLWLYRLLHDFEARALYSGKMQAFFDHLRYHATRRWPIAILVSMLTVALAVATALASGEAQVALGAVSAIVLTIVATILTTLLIDRWGET